MSERRQDERASTGPTASLGLGPVACDLPGGARPVRAEVSLRFEPGTAPDAVTSAAAALTDELGFLLGHGSFTSGTDAALALCHYALAPPTDDAPRAAAREASAQLFDPGGAIGRASERAGRYGRESKPFGRVDVIHESPACGIYRLRIRPGGAIPTHVHAVMDEREMVLGAGLRVQGRAVARGTVFRWPHGFPHRYDNPTETEQTVLCVDRPRFDPDDEREVPEPAGGLVPPAPARG